MDRKEAARKMGVSEHSLNDWESHRSKPGIFQIPKIIRFLGYVPDFLNGRTRGEQIRTKRLLLGLGRRELAQLLGTHDTMIERWEKNHIDPPMDLEEKLDKLFGSF